MLPMAVTSPHGERRDHMAYKFDYSKLNGRIVEKYGTRKAFAKKVGITESALSNKLNHRTSVMTGDIVSWASALGINTDEIGSYFFAKEVQ